MDRPTFSAICQYYDMVHGVTVRAIAAFTDADLDFRPKPGMRTPRELIFHIYAQEKSLAEAAVLGRFTGEAAASGTPEDPSAAPQLAALVTVDDVVLFAKSCHDAAMAAFNALTEDQVNQPVESPYGTFPAWRFFAFINDEHWHHRGQLYTYIRLLGKEPPMLYDYGSPG